MSTSWFEDQSRRSRARLDRAIVLSLCLHALILLLQFGITGFGLPGLSSPVAESLSLTVRLAEVPAVVPRIAARKIRERKVPPAAPREKQPEEKDVTSSEPPDISPEVTPPAPAEEETREIASNEPREAAAVVAAPAPREEEPQQREVTLSAASDTNFVMPPPAPREQEPKPKEAVAENAKEAPQTEPAPVEEAKTQEQPAPEEQASPQEEPARPQQASAERQEPEPEAGRQAEEGTQEQAQAPAGQPDLEAGQPNGVQGQEQAQRFGIDLDALRVLKEQDTRPEDQQEEPEEEVKKQEAAPAVREREAAAAPEKAKETLAPVEEATPVKVVRAAKLLPCDEPEGRFLAARELERSGDLKGSFLAFKESAECGYGLAQRKLGDLYGTGNAAVLRDYEISLRWYRKARDQGIEIHNMARRLRSY